MVAINSLGFTQWIRDNTALTEGSITVYVRAINNFCSMYDDLTVENMNAYISRSVRSRNSSYMKYAFKHYLTFIDKPELYESLHKIKIPPRKKMGVYRSPDLIRELINSIEFERHRDKALIQYAIGARARGVITLHDNRLDLHFEDDAIRIILREKGDKEQEAFLHRSFEPILKRYMGHGYLFLPKEANNFEPQDFERCVENERTYYFSAVSEAAKKMGMNRFGTHDFRRNAIDNWDKMVDDDSTVQQGAGHSDKRMTERYIGRRRQEVKHMMLNHQMDVK